MPAESPSSSADTTVVAQLLDGVKNSQDEEILASVHRMLEHPEAFEFRELLSLPNFKEFTNQDADAHMLYQLVEVFCFGTLSTYWDLFVMKKVPSLSVAEEKKLQLLTIMSVASEKDQLSFSELVEHVFFDARKECISDERRGIQSMDLSQGVYNDISQHRMELELHKVLIDCFFYGLIAGRIDEEARCVEISQVKERDISEEHIDKMLTTFQRFLEKSIAVESALSNRESENHTPCKNVELNTGVSVMNAGDVRDNFHTQPTSATQPFFTSMEWEQINELFVSSSLTNRGEQKRAKKCLMDPHIKGKK
ncbi:putative COP9 signalosome complex subunit 7 [Cardiosporidium cionae]|uniref:COP9 signalosome complex subunit 7 n=1 Tax=Cardiosporidium cionae TaxID=476202 RepID=A0ABQ7JBA3_9APIC|nr:putative COP9 signalosome complex subunit 7 [Cardiosporidium cionae]|eukprot:KAF8821285.1 putative COP9 signalosome complex subunit 7 [Cardiosporidium cionae]